MFHSKTVNKAVIEVLQNKIQLGLKNRKYQSLIINLGHFKAAVKNKWPTQKVKTWSEIYR